MSKDVVIDTKPLLFILAGLYGHNTIKEFGGSEEDYNLINRVIAN